MVVLTKLNDTFFILNIKDSARQCVTHIKPAESMSIPAIKNPIFGNFEASLRRYIRIEWSRAHTQSSRVVYEYVSAGHQGTYQTGPYPLQRTHRSGRSANHMTQCQQKHL